MEVSVRLKWYNQKNTEHQYTIDALAQSEHSDNKITLTNLTLLIHRIIEIFQNFVRSDKILWHM